MRDPFTSGRPKRRWLRAMEIDSWIDSTLYESKHDFSRIYENITIFMRRFKATGLSRVFSEILSEGATLSVAGALLVLALALPAFEAVKKDWLTQTEYSVTFLDRYGNEIGRRGVLHDDSFELDDLPDHVIQAVLATEDRRFFEHFGIDVFGTFRAVMENARAGGVVQGGSSITQQLAKNLFLTPERSMRRKINEAFLALWIEARLSKDEILKMYLDRSYLGGGTYGVEAAAQF
jgi:penicillin-binding protein 1A